MSHENGVNRQGMGFNWKTTRMELLMPISMRHFCIYIYRLGQTLTTLRTPTFKGSRQVITWNVSTLSFSVRQKILFHCEQFFTVAENVIMLEIFSRCVIRNLLYGGALYCFAHLPCRYCNPFLALNQPSLLETQMIHVCFYSPRTRRF